MNGGQRMLQIPSICTGCHACKSICPQKCIIMKKTDEGFFFPVIDSKNCIGCELCKKVCPVLYASGKSQFTQAYAVKSKDEVERNNSSSGGVFPLLAKQVLQKEGIIYGAAYDKNFVVRHIAVTDSINLPVLQGAKYVQSIIGDVFLEIEQQLKSGRKVLFSGTPCQCAGLKAFLRRNYDNLTIVDMICHGVPSSEVWQRYIDFRAREENDGKYPIRINMRSKVDGWSRYSTEFDYGNNKITRIPNRQDPFMRAFIGNICLRSSCSACVEKGVERCTDITIGDYWGIWNQHPEFNDEKGTSIVFVHTTKGKNILNAVKEQIVRIEIDVEDAFRENMSMMLSSVAHEKRGEFLDRVMSENFGELVNNYFPPVVIEKQNMWKCAKKLLDKYLNRK